VEREAAAQQRRSLTPFFSKASKAIDEASEYRKQLTQRQDAKRKQKLLKELSDLDYLGPYKLARSKRHQGTCGWFLETEAFKGWRDANGPSTLCVLGNLGCGKTILSAAALDQLFSTRQTTQRVLFTFATPAQRASLKAETILRCLARQLLQVETLSNEMESQLCASKNAFWSLRSLTELLKEAIKDLSCVYVVLDGLDEMDLVERRGLLKYLTPLLDPNATTKPFNLLLSSRSILQDELTHLFPSSLSLRVDATATRDDLGSYVQAIVKERHDLRDLAVKDEALLGEIVTALTDGAQGM
jgi:hypothetical protein